jgi:hypothetical protein
MAQVPSGGGTGPCGPNTGRHSSDRSGWEHGSVTAGFVAELHGGPNDGDRIRVPDPPPEEWKIPLPVPLSLTEAPDPLYPEVHAAVYRLVRHERPPDPHRTLNPNLSVTVYSYDGTVGAT